MTVSELLQILVYLTLLVILTPVLGSFISNVYFGEKTILTIPLGWLERAIYKTGGINHEKGMKWKEYSLALLIFNTVGFLAVFSLQLFQSNLPLNPQNLPDVPLWLSFNTAVSFMTNTNWQSYSGESMLSYLTQMLGLTVQNFVSAATGMAVLMALSRGITRQFSGDIGNFYADLVRGTLYILLPLSVILSVLLMNEGVIQSFSSYITTATLEGHEQIIPSGPAASQIAIKQIGTNGGGFFGVNCAHPFENPTPFSNFLEMFFILLIPASLTYTFGIMTGNKKQGWTIFAAMFILLSAGLAVSLYSEYQTNPAFGIEKSLEGKEVRFGTANSVLWGTVTTAASNGSVNAMHDSFSPLSGMVFLINILLGEVIFGGVGAGLYGMLIFVFLTVFISGLMVGRTPEYLGKKIESFEMKMVMLVVLLPSAVILIFSGIASVTDSGLSSLTNRGPHGFSEILYAFASAAGNNGSAFAGLSTNTNFYNILLGIAMLVGRFGVIIPVLAIAGNMSCKKVTPESSGSLLTDNALFVILLIAVILIVGALTFFPALSLSAVAEHFLMISGKEF